MDKQKALQKLVDYHIKMDRTSAIFTPNFNDFYDIQKRRHYDTHHCHCGDGYDIWYRNTKDNKVWFSFIKNEDDVFKYSFKEFVQAVYDAILLSSEQLTLFEDGDFK